MDPGSLQKSRWAPGFSTLYAAKEQCDGNNINGEASAKSNKLKAVQRSQRLQVQDYENFCRLLRRLKWKSTTLLFCHNRAMSQSTDNVISGLNFPISSDTGKANAAEIMFKVDFFEFYALLERVLVHLLGCFGMVITADNAAVPLAPSTTDLNRSKYSDAVIGKNSIIGDSRAFYGYAHRFHANVLAALDLKTNPLHHILGTGKVRQYLGLAKEFRNRWKEVDVDNTESQDQFVGLHRSYHQILVDLKLDEMLAALLSALDQARVIAYEHLPLSQRTVEINMLNDADEDHALTEDMMMDDAMEWD
ncbi:hypothetical protein H2198_008080 [Neophaeococcomyces mojaviensis]|uniref:Uncharacterized protein n=1 Tax=Neophaeococcomyces mojaviensis TaxID=3383035 RepID=A0ACC2ZYC7_9EURO|nr:hypothetical protein H2198_008080 [Knufia sp. JES_112]